jgi:hypothetical protein
MLEQWQQWRKGSVEDKILDSERKKSFFPRIFLDGYLLVRSASTNGFLPHFDPVFHWFAHIP